MHQNPFQSPEAPDAGRPLPVQGEFAEDQDVTFGWIVLGILKVAAVTIAGIGLFFAALSFIDKP